MGTKRTFLSLVSVAVFASLFFGTRPVPDRLFSPADARIDGNSLVGATLIVGSTTSALLVPAGSSVYDAMAIVASTTGFRFSAQSYPGLGYFVESVNDVANGGGFYWTLYVNGRYSTTGASSRVLQALDVVEWRFEKR